MLLHSAQETWIGSAERPLRCMNRVAFSRMGLRKPLAITLRSTDRNSDKADTMCPQDFRTKHFYFSQKRASKQLFSLASKLRNFWPLKFILKSNSNYLSGRNRLNISYIYIHIKSLKRTM